MGLRLTPGLGLGSGCRRGLVSGVSPGVALELGEPAGGEGVGVGWRGPLHVVSVAASSNVEPAHASGFGRIISTSSPAIVVGRLHMPSRIRRRAAPGAGPSEASSCKFVGISGKMLCACLSMRRGDGFIFGKK
ncbi:MAG: hypothetical protein LBC26_07225 [Oscillospiraceae bacterium]|nr:hypothetical protein [Oscillospiraceae bacterium]